MAVGRMSAVLAVLALGLLLTTAGAAAVASTEDHGPAIGGHFGAESSHERERGEGSRTTSRVTAPGTGLAWNGRSSADRDSIDSIDSGGAHDDGHDAGEPHADGGVDAAGSPAGVPQTSAVAPAAAANGPAPVAAAAPASGGVVGREVTLAGSAAPDVARPAAVPPTPAAPAAVEDPFPSAGLPQLGPPGGIAASVDGGPSTPRRLLATPAGRSLAALGGLVLAILLFLVVHRRLDRSDPKLAAPRLGSDVARFR